MRKLPTLNILLQIFQMSTKYGRSYKWAGARHGKDAIRYLQHTSDIILLFCIILYHLLYNTRYIATLSYIYNKEDIKFI